MNYLYCTLIAFEMENEVVVLELIDGKWLFVAFNFF